MKVLIINPIMYTCENNNIKKVSSLKDTLLYSVCMGFIKNGDEPTLITASDYKPTINEDYPFEIKFFDTKYKKIFLPRFLPYMYGLNKYLKKHNSEYDYVICSEAFQICTLTASKYFKNRCFIWQEMAKHQKKFHKIPSKIWHNIIVKHRFNKCYVVPRSEDAKEFISKYAKNVSNEVIEHGIDIDKFDCDKKNVKKQFIIVSQLIERKQIDKIINVFKKYVEIDNEYKLVVCGEGDCKTKLEDQVKNLKLSKNVKFLGQCDHKVINEEFSKSKAMLIYTKKDNNMVSIIESITSGTPVITTSVPYNSRYIKKEKLGIVDDNWNEKDLKEICDNFDKYYNNCLKYRNKISSEHTAYQFNSLFKQNKA